MLAGHHDVAVAEVDLDAAQPVRLAGIGADATTPMEVGSMTKAMTGLVIADAVRRGEIRMDAPVAIYLPQLTGSPAGRAGCDPGGSRRPVDVPDSGWNGNSMTRSSKRTSSMLDRLVRHLPGCCCLQPPRKFIAIKHRCSPAAPPRQ
jgi:hypothetical protein